MAVLTQEKIDRINELAKKQSQRKDLQRKKLPKDTSSGRNILKASGAISTASCQEYR